MPVGYGIGRRVLGADADCDSFASGRVRESQGHGRHGNRYRELVDVADHFILIRLDALRLP